MSKRERRIHTPNVCRNVIHNDQRGRHPEPDDTFEDIVDDEVTADNDKKETHVDPAEKTELASKLVTFQVGHESYESQDVKHEGDEAMVSGEGDEVSIDEDDVLEIVDDCFAV